VGIHYSDKQQSHRCRRRPEGFSWSLVANASQTQGAVTPQIRGTFDFGLPLPIPNSSIWLRSAAGGSKGDRNNTLANFYFGGFGNNYVDSRSVQRYREYNSLPGFEIDQVSAHNFVRELGEWNLPPIVFESVGTQGFHLTWLRPAVFGTLLWTDVANPKHRQNYANAGAQADLKFSVLHWYDMTLSVGYAVGFQGTKRAGSEWMVSLKIM
jgi:hypothetical protein